MSYDKLLYIGRNTLRHEDEPEYEKDVFGSREVYAQEHPWAYPHVFIAYDDEPIEYKELFKKQALRPKGSSSVLVGHQKLVRDSGNSLKQINRWRASFKTTMLEGRDIESYEAKDPDDALYEISEHEEPFVILKPKSVDLEIELTVEDMRDKLMNIFEQNGLDQDMLKDKPDATIRSMFKAMKND